MIDVMVAMPGSTAKEIEERAHASMEKLLWEVPGVEYLYSTSRDSESLVIVRFKVAKIPSAQPREAHGKNCARTSTACHGRHHAHREAEEHRRRAHPRAHIS